MASEDRAVTRADPGDRDRYLARLGVEAEPPSAEALARLHRAHVERVPYETLWIHLGQGWDLDPATSLARIAATRRGGYCFHLNGALAHLLAALGYRVTHHVGGVHGPDGATEAEMTNHLVLVVHDLPTAAHPAGTWYVDVGLGDALHEPLPLRAGSYAQGPFRYTLTETPEAVGDWHLGHDRRGGFTGMAWRSDPIGLDAFADRHRWLSTSPDSGFVKVLTAQRRDSTGVDCLKGLWLRRIEDATTESTLASLGELVEVLTDRFGLDLSSVDPDQLTALWDRLHRAHLRWEAAGRP